MSTQPDQQDDRELPVAEWAKFFDKLSRRAEDVAVETTIELLGGEVPGVEAERLPLAGISYEDGDHAIAVDLGGRGQRFPVVLRHFVDRPRRVLVHDEDGQPAALAIVSEDGTTTLVRLHAAV
ncbi:MAG TPA: DUF5335 family protein [Conexibacter sp.]|jgi:hypothetical protein|nr:DUF5335 family protein [Conexibacter sp.]